MREILGSIVVLTLLAVSAGAATPTFQPPKRPILPRTGDPSANAQSLYQRNGGSLLKATLNAQPDAARAELDDVSFFAVPVPEPKTLKKHDLVTIIIREESAFSSKGTTDLKKSNDLDARIEEFVKLELDKLTIRGGALGANPPSVKYSAERNFKGEGTVDRTDSMTARITAEVVDVKPNGTLVLQARKRIKTDDEEQEIILSGICNVADIAPDNTLLSTQLHDLDLTKRTKGAVRDTTKRGWLPKLLDAINPF